MKDTITTLDRYKASPRFGEVITIPVNLLDKPRTGYLATQMTGSVKHGQEVTIIDKKQEHQDIWCKVVCDVEGENDETYHQEGWVKRQFLEEEGKSYFDQEWNE